MPAKGEAPEVGWVGWLAHDPLQDRCPRAAPNPSYKEDKSALERASMGRRPHASGTRVLVLKHPQRAGFLPTKPSKPKHLGATQGFGSARYAY